LGGAGVYTVARRCGRLTSCGRVSRALSAMLADPWQGAAQPEVRGRSRDASTLPGHAHARAPVRAPRRCAHARRRPPPPAAPQTRGRGCPRRSRRRCRARRRRTLPPESRRSGSPFGGGAKEGVGPRRRRRAGGRRGRAWEGERSAQARICFPAAEVWGPREGGGGRGAASYRTEGRPRRGAQPGCASVRGTGCGSLPETACAAVSALFRRAAGRVGGRV
jgi:hypothetical protein